MNHRSSSMAGGVITSRHWPSGAMRMITGCESCGSFPGPPEVILRADPSIDPSGYAAATETVASPEPGANGVTLASSPGN
jgi:hypothetical protein